MLPTGLQQQFQFSIVSESLYRFEFLLSAGVHPAGAALSFFTFNVEIIATQASCAAVYRWSRVFGGQQCCLCLTLSFSACWKTVSSLDPHIQTCITQCRSVRVFSQNKTQSLLIISSLMQGYSGVNFISCSWQTPLTQAWTHFNRSRPVSNKAEYYVGRDLLLCPDIILWFGPLWKFMIQGQSRYFWLNQDSFEHSRCMIAIQE